MRFHRRWGARKLRHRIFLALCLTIIVAVSVAGAVTHAVWQRSSETNQMREFASERFAAVWDDPRQRLELVESIQRHFNVSLTLLDAERSMLYRGTARCERHGAELELFRDDRRLGYVIACYPGHGWPRSATYLLLTVVFVLWAMSGLIARSLVRPLDQLVRVVRRIGDGQLDARMQLCRHHYAGEVGEVAHAINQMAEKIERQISGQRELLAAVSHEIRSPLARLRMLVEMQRERAAHVTQEITQGTTRLDSMDLELTELDSLVGQLLAQSRLEFQNLECRTIPARDLAMTALARAGIDSGVFMDESDAASISVDVGLMGRALLNVLENAQRHGQVVVSLRLCSVEQSVLFEVRDAGKGFEASMLARGLEPFVGTSQSGGLGLGLSLVHRIVRAHAGKVELANAEQGGAIVTITLPRVVEG